MQSEMGGLRDIKETSMATVTHAALTPLQVCQALLARVDAADGDRDATLALYEEQVGHDPFANDPAMTTADATDVLRDVVRELAHSFGLHWSLVEPEPELPGHSFVVDGHTYTLPEMLDANRDSPEVCAWVLAAAPGDTYRGMLDCSCVA